MISWALLRPTPRLVSQFMVLKELFRFAQPFFRPCSAIFLKRSVNCCLATTLSFSASSVWGCSFSSRKSNSCFDYSGVNLKGLERTYSGCRRMKGVERISSSTAFSSCGAEVNAGAPITMPFLFQVSTSRMSLRISSAPTAGAFETFISRVAANQIQELTGYKSDKSEFIPVYQIYTPPS